MGFILDDILLAPCKVVTWIGRGGTSRSLKVLTKTNGRWRQVWQQATPILNP